MKALTINPPSADLDEMGEASFPASDPPAVWTWDVRPAPTAAPDPQPDPAGCSDP